MKIVLVCRVYSTHRSGGMPFVCADRAVHLANGMGHDVHVLTTAHENGKASDVVDGVTVHYLGNQPMEYAEAWHESCARKVSAINPDLIHLDSLDSNATPWWPAGSVAITSHGSTIGQLMALQSSAVGGDDVPKQKINDLIEGCKRERAVLKTARAVVAVSEWERRLLSEIYQLPNVHVVKNPIPDYFFGTRKSPKNRDVRKRVFLCAAVNSFGTRGFHLATNAASLNRQTVHFAKGSFTRREMVEQYDHCDALLLPTSLASGSDLTVDEALARRRPVIATRIGAYSGRQGVVNFTRDDVHELAAVMAGDLPLVLPNEENRCSNHCEKWLGVVCQ